ncbi:uncharacterized protein BO66DRAFT_399479 [Aspergillus aculeatinus CBS 121060]|uniref:Uncharacterized protein n=1 Tax=Aspergillus aculeatinus CBS 121060 TaxID=1448322 RepID=A0ACD1HGC0_9EURO|nr:hypothetical protein BO66DRAFT_399479 [Aspergillus aculeatinus CBS 121060]RAH72545.1 hypothetical protein BO66DRAFT_399479 [Aspergillus aculeatinus CBS 121060]
MSGQIENIPLHTREPGDEITEADLAKLLEATDPLTTSATVAAAAAAAAATQGTTVTFNLEDLFVEYAYDEEDEDEEDAEDDDGADEIYYNEAMDGWLGPWWASV